MSENEKGIDYRDLDYETIVPFELLAGLKDKSNFNFENEMYKMREIARTKGVTAKEFDGKLNAYLADYNEGEEIKKTKPKPKLVDKSLNNFDFSTNFKLTDEGAIFDYQNECVISHPIYISRRLIDNIDKTEKVELTYKPNDRWMSITVDKSTIASSTKIVTLADYGISVTTDNANLLIKYLQDFDNINYETIPIKRATSALGWTDQGDFVPYSDRLDFSGDMSLQSLFESVETKGDFELWQDTIIDFRERSIAAKIMLAAAAASPVLSVLGIDTAFCHVWSTKSGTGKSLLAMVAASLWGNPESGQYLQSFNSTTVAIERYAETLQHCPLVLDELQLSSKYKGQTTFSVYNLASGQGKGRGRRDGGLQRQGTWRLMVLTTGESPIVKNTDGQGAFARAIEIELKDQLVDFTEGNKIANTIRDNYGFGGEIIVNEIKRIGKETIKEMYQTLGTTLQSLSKGEIHDKQLMTATALLIGDSIMWKVLKRSDDKKPASHLTPDEVISVLVRKDDSSVELRAIDVINDWININRSRFKVIGDNESLINFQPQQLAGYIDEDERTVYFIPSVMRNEVLMDEVNNYTSALSALADIGVIEVEQGTSNGKVRYGVRKFIDGKQQRFNVYNMEKADEFRN